ncbi:type VI secretion system baseplate subunit TssG [Metakosakonia massiliensis]|uniref:Type VI secretion system baseplate subunit TssG n=1 Tax=Phytobacter massiliensis TaxID=1485952 RepID=A0A6N3AMH1_9ENTR
MACDHWSALAEIDTCQYEFYQLAELLYRHYGEGRTPDADSLPQDELLRFIASGSLSFPTSDLKQVRKDDNGQLWLETTFLGLQGSQSPLPGFYLESTAWEYTQDMPGVNHFLDLFNHRAMTLLHRIWRKYRHHITFDGEGNDAFSARLFSLAGLGSPAIRGTLQIPPTKLLAYAGPLSGASRSPEVVCGLIAHCFDINDVTILPWQIRSVPVPEEQITLLGGRNSILDGNTFIVGDRLNDCSGKFTLCLNNLSLESYLTFLPMGESFQPLKNFTSFIIRDQFAFDIRLTLAPGQIEPMNFESEVTHFLGWTTFIGELPSEPGVTLCMRE